MLRRDFLSLCSSLIGTAVATPLLSAVSSASTLGNKRLIVVFQRGGSDGLNTVVPYGDDDYYSLRPTIAIPAPGSASSGRALSIDHSLFALHPALAPLADIYQNGELAFLPAVQFPRATRSHFVNQQTIERGALPGADGGWLNRLLTGQSSGGELAAVSIGQTISDALRGDVPVPVIQELGVLPFASEDFFASLSSLYDGGSAMDEGNREVINNQGRLMLKHRERFMNLTEQDYAPDNGANYPGSTFGNELRRIAQLVKSDAGLQYATVDSYGWDTHQEQGGAEGTHARSLGNLASGIAALYTDLGPDLMRDTLILTMTEFGRTAAENGSGGTDHGHAAAWFAVGGGVAGGVHGSWPGLRTADLVDGSFLTHSVDCRDVMCEVIAAHLGRSDELASLMPGHVYQPVGFL